MTDKRSVAPPVARPVAALDEIFLTETQLAERHRISVKSIRNARVYGGYVKFVKIGRNVRYRLSDVLEFEAAHVQRSTSDREADDD